MYNHIYIHRHICIHTDVYAYMHLHEYMYVATHACMHVCVCVCVCARARARVCLYKCVYTYNICTHSHSHLYTDHQTMQEGKHKQGRPLEVLSLAINFSPCLHQLRAHVCMPSISGPMQRCPRMPIKRVNRCAPAEKSSYTAHHAAVRRGVERRPMNRRSDCCDVCPPI